MSDASAYTNNKIPRPIWIIGTFQTALGLWWITSMAISGEWSLFLMLFAIGYTILGGGLLAIFEWARFSNVVSPFCTCPISSIIAICISRRDTGARK